MMQFLKNLFIASLLLGCSSLAFGSATHVYVAQNAAGAGSGADCSNARATSFFNSSANWGSGTTQIGPGTTVHLCGTISSAITAQGSGVAGSPITIAFDCASNGQIAMPAIPAIGALTISGLSNIVLDGQGCGIIKSTNNGSPAGGYANRVGSQAIMATNTNNIEVKNLQCLSLYMHVNPEQTPFGSPYPNCINFTGTSSNINIHHNTFKDCAWCAWGQGNNISFHDNQISNFDHGLGMGIHSDSPLVMKSVYFYNNTLSNASAWDTGSAGQYHHDGIHLWAYCSDGYSNCPNTYWQDAYVYNNRFLGDWGLINTTAMVFAQGSDVHNFWVFNNLADCSANQCDDGVISIQSSNGANVINNTVVANMGAQVTPNLILGGPNLRVQNNIVSTSNFLVNITPSDESGGAATTISALSNNVWMNGGNNAFVWKGTFLGFNQFSTWASSSGEVNSKTAAASTVTAATGALQSGSPAIGAGANLYSLCAGQPNPGVGALCSDINGNPRPSSGAWDAGAISSSAATTTLQPPATISLVIQ